MEEILTFPNPLTDEELKIERMPSRYHLVDSLKELMFGRPAESQKVLTKWIQELEEDLSKGVPLT